jgi:hypothetical protein
MKEKIKWYVFKWYRSSSSTPWYVWDFDTKKEAVEFIRKEKERGRKGKYRFQKMIVK